MLTTTLWDLCFFVKTHLVSVINKRIEEKVAVCVFNKTSGGGRTHDLPLRRRTPYPFGHGGGLAENGFDPLSFGLWAQRASAAPLCFLFCRLVSRCCFTLSQIESLIIVEIVCCEHL